MGVLKESVDGSRRASSHRTYWHLANGGDRGDSEQRPTDYEIATSRLLYYVGRGFETRLPLADWYRRHQLESPFACDDWEQFRDPRETTYAGYTAHRDQEEARVDQILLLDEDTGHDTPLDRSWVETLETILPPARYLFHAFQMIGAYVGQLAPSGRITVASAFQAADEMRRVHRLARWLATARRTREMFGADAKQRWQEDPAWQPARMLAERMLVAYDWGEAFAALNLCAKPALDAFFYEELGTLASSRGDDRLRVILTSLAEDGAWHRSWSEALVAMAVDARPGNRDTLRLWVGKWIVATDQAVRSLGTLAGGDGAEAATSGLARAKDWRQRIGVEP